MTRRHSPTDEERRTVKALSGYGVPQEDIAIHMDMDAKTLRKHYRRELDRGTIEANAKVAQTLFTMATVDKNVAAAIFWMKARGGWREKPLPDDEPADQGARRLVVGWISPEDVPRSEQYPGGRKIIAKDTDYE